METFGCAALLAGCGEDSAFNKGFEEQFAAEFTKSCESSAISAGAPADLNRDGAVDGADLGVLLSAWGACGP